MLQRQRDAQAGLNTARLHLRLPRLAARRPRPGAVEGAEVPRARAHQVPARASTRTSPPPRSGARSRSTCIRERESSTACSRCGTARARAWTAAATCSSTPTSPAPSKHGGVLVLAGDDHAAKSSTLPHQCDHQFSAAMMPVLYPSSVQEILDLGLHGLAMSRYSGCWVGLKCVSDIVESSASVDVDPDRVEHRRPRRLPAAARRRVTSAGPTPFLATEARMQDYKFYAALHYCRANQLNRIVIDSPEAAARHHHQRQELPRRPPGARRPRHRRSRRRRHRHPRVQGRDAVAARARRRARSSPKAWTRSSSSRRSARSSSTS